VAVEYLPFPLHLSFAVHAVAVLGAAFVVYRAPETVDVQPGARLSAQRLAVPADVRAVFVSAATAGFTVLGLFTAISPRILSDDLGVPNHAVAGLVAFLLLGSSAFAQLGLRRLPTARALVAGCSLLIVGVLLVGFAVAEASFPALPVVARSELRRQSPDLVGLGDIRGQERRPQPGRGGSGRRRRPPDDRHVVSVHDQAPGDLPADPAGAADDECRLPRRGHVNLHSCDTISIQS
jgi:hypothetical protein